MDEPKKRAWSNTTAYTRAIGARLPLALYDRLKDYCETSGDTTTDVVCNALRNYLDEREEGGRGLFV